MLANLIDTDIRTGYNSSKESNSFQYEYTEAQAMQPPIRFKMLYGVWLRAFGYFARSSHPQISAPHSLLTLITSVSPVNRHRISYAVEPHSLPSAKRLCLPSHSSRTSVEVAIIVVVSIG
jgi:hypothetical protein